MHGRGVRGRDNGLVAEGLDLMLAGHPFAVGRDVDRAFPLVHVNAHLVHGWPLPSAELTAGGSCAALCLHVKRETSRYIPSTLRPLKRPPRGPWRALDMWGGGRRVADTSCRGVRDDGP